MINIGIIYLKGHSRHIGQKKVRKRDPFPKKGGQKREQDRGGSTGFWGGTCWVPRPPWRLRGAARPQFHCPVERCEVLRTSYWLPMALDPPSGGEQPIAGGWSPLTGWDWQGGVLLTTRPAILSGMERAAAPPLTALFPLPSPPQGLQGPPQHGPLSPQGPSPHPQQVPLPLSTLEDSLGAWRKGGPGHQSWWGIHPRRLCHKGDLSVTRLHSGTSEWMAALSLVAMAAQVSLCMCSCKVRHSQQAFCHQTNTEGDERKNPSKKGVTRGKPTVMRSQESRGSVQRLLGIAQEDQSLHGVKVHNAFCPASAAKMPSWGLRSYHPVLKLSFLPFCLLNCIWARKCLSL